VTLAYRIVRGSARLARPALGTNGVHQDQILDRLPHPVVPAVGLSSLDAYSHSICTGKLFIILLDLIGVAMICCGAWVQHWLRHAEATNAEQPSPLDERAATPL
jgi:hypothetical protein